MGAGIPVICSDFPVWKIIVDENGCGITVNPNNILEIEKAIHYLVNNNALAEEIGKSGRTAVEVLYNWATEEKKLLALYEDMLK